jgi:Holliday junction resolvase RusA-like endonuclease
MASSFALAFTVLGAAQPKGSARGFIPKGWKRPIITSDNPKNKGWQQLVAEAASHAIQQELSFRLFEAAVSLDVTFYLPRPKSIRDRDVPHLKKPDLDKLVRSVKDALSKVVWQDDSQVTAIMAAKRYAAPGESPRAVIVVDKIRGVDGALDL